MNDLTKLTPSPGGQDVVIPFASSAGRLRLTCELVHAAGRVQLVGLHIQAPPAGASGPVLELSHSVLRSLKAGELAATATANLRTVLTGEARSRRLTQPQREHARELLRLVDERPSPRPRVARPVSEQLEKVAALFQAALAAGGEAARTPSLFVHHALAAEGSSITHNAVRQQIHRARRKGLIPPAGRASNETHEVTT